MQQVRGSVAASMECVALVGQKLIDSFDQSRSRHGRRVAGGAFDVEAAKGMRKARVDIRALENNFIHLHNL